MQIATKYDNYGQTPKTCHDLDWMGEGLLDLCWMTECICEEWMSEAFLDLSWMPDVQEWAEDDDNIEYLAENCDLPWDLPWPRKK